MSEKTKQLILTWVILGVSVFVLLGGVYLYSGAVAKFVEKDTKQMLIEASGRGGALMEEKVRSHFTLLHSIADSMERSEELWSDGNMELLQRQYERNKDTVARFLIVNAEGMARTTDGLEGYMGNDPIFAEAMTREEVVSGVVPSAVKPDTQVIVLAVQVRQGEQVKGIVACVYNMSEYERVMNSSILGSYNYSYVVEKNGNAVIWPTGMENPLGITKDSDFSDQALMEARPYLSALHEDMARGQMGVHRFTCPEGGEFYMAYRPVGLNDWYYIDVVPTEAVSQKTHAATIMVLTVSMATVLILFLMAGAIVVSGNKRRKVIRQYTFRDRLTGLRNWNSFKELFDGLPADKYIYALFHLNDFIYINNMFGYEVGGNILRDIAARLEQFTEDGEYSSRLSENYFGMYLHNQDGEALKRRLGSLSAILENIQVKDDTVVYDYRCFFTGSVCAIGQEEKTQGFEQLNSKMDAISETAESSHKTSWNTVDEAAKKEIELRRSLSGDVLKALSGRQFVPYFQPLYELENKTICQAEVLVRWNHPDKGVLLPKTFLKILEASGCSLEMDLIMLDEACRCLHAWMENGLLPAPLTFNISGLNIYRQDFVSSVCAIPMKYKIPASLITLELPEKIILENFDKVLSVAKELKKKGFRLSVDNFGSGQGSFKLLNSVPLDVIKMHSGFLRDSASDERCAFVVSRVIQIADSLDIQVVGSGVETQEDEACIQKLGCSAGQGFLYARPQSAQEFKQLLNQENAWGK